MKQFQISYDNKTEFSRKIEELKKKCEGISSKSMLFYITWTDILPEDLQDVMDILDSAFPDTGYYGNQTSGNIAMGDFRNGIQVCCYVLEDEDSEAEILLVSKNDKIKTLEELWDYCNTKKGLRGVELIPSMSYLDSLQLDCNVPTIDKDILIFGGASSSLDFNPYKADVIVKGHDKTYEGMIVVLYSGKNMNFSADNILGWKGLGRLMEVTASEGKKIIEIENEPAYSIYEKYLNLTVDDRDMLVFPLIVEEDGTEYIRSPHTIVQDKSMMMFVNIPLGTKLRISYGDKNTILDSIYNKALEISQLNPEAIKAYSCAGRRLFWGDLEVGSETKMFNDIAPVNGFYSGGEILRFGDKIRVMNQTLVIVTLNETNSVNDNRPVDIQKKALDKSLVSRLAYFTQKVSEEQEKTFTMLEDDKAILRENMGMIKGLAEEYLALFYVNIDEFTYKIYSIDESLLNIVRSKLGEAEIGPDIFQRFGKLEFIHPDDRYLFENIDIKYIRDKLVHRKKFSVRFRQKFGSEYLWMEMDIVKYDAIDERANEIAVGFAERDAEIRSEQATNSCFTILNRDLTPQESINELMSLAGEYYGAERCYIFEYANKKDFINNTFEWCAEGVEAMISHLQNIPSKEIDGWVKAFKQNGAFYLDSLDEDDAYNTIEGREILEMQGIESLIAAPIMNGEEMVGFVGVDNPTKAKKNIIILQNVAVVSLSEMLRIKESDEEHITLEKLSDTFLSVYYVDLTWDYMHTWKIDNAYKSAYGSVEHYSVAMGGYVRNCIAVRDRTRCIRMTSPEYVMQQFKTKDRFSIDMTDIMLGYERDVVFDYVKVNGDGSQFVVCCRDVTDTLAREKAQQKQLQDALEAADAANKSKTNFLFNMSHDIRTPMNAIIGFTNMAIKHIDDREKSLDCLNKTQQSGNMLLSLINSVLEVSRIESGHATLEEKHGDVYFSFVNLETTMLELAKSKDITLTFEFGEIHDRYVYCDFDRCMRIFVNIISNAIKYTNEGGTVKVRCEQLGTANNGTALFCYTVTDNGIGMSEDFQKHVFEQFSRENTATVSGIQGTGLGMAVCKSFVDLMGGTISCESKQGKGSKFTIILPFKLQEGVAYTDPVTGALISGGRKEPTVINYDFSGKRVLLVDDNEMNREIAVEILTDGGLVVEDADDGTTAVKVMKEKGPDYYDFILMDIQMPVMNGFEASKLIREMYPEKKIPIIALSANAFAEDRAASIEAGMCDHVAKPINIEELFKVLGKYLE